MAPTVIYCQYDGEWKEDKGSYEWSPRNQETISIVVEDSSIKFAGLVEKLYGRLDMDRNDTELKLSYLPYCPWEKLPPLILRGDECLVGYLLDRGEHNRRSTLRVEVFKKDGSDTSIEECKNEDEQKLQDDYFDSDLLMEGNVCDAASAPGCIAANPGDATVDPLIPDTTASAPTPQSPQLDFEVFDDHEPLDGCSSDRVFSFTDESDLTIGQEFANKDEVKKKLENIAFNACFEMNIKRSTKSLYVTKCVDTTCKWAVRAAKIGNSERFSIRTYCNTHTCSKRKKKHRRISVAAVAAMVKSHFECQKEMLTPKSIMTMMQNCGTPVTYWKAWKGKQIAQDIKELDRVLGESASDASSEQQSTAGP